MTHTINWSISVQIAGGPKLSLSKPPLLVEEYVVSQVTVPTGTAEGDAIRVQIQPTVAGDNLATFLLVSADAYEDSAHNHLQYKVTDAGSPKILAGPLLLIGVDAVKLLSDEAGELFFFNPMDQDAVVDILVGRDATPDN